MNRRHFNRISATAMASLSSGIPIHSWALEGRRPNEQFNVGLIGCNGMGFFNLTNHLKQQDVVCVGLCDVDQKVLDEKAAELEKNFGQKPQLYTDFRNLLENKDLDAVIIGTPDHWHCLQTVLACEAGKDVYVEKPMANSIAEARAMVVATRTYQRIVQVGQQQRSGAHWQEVVRFIQNGKLGKVRNIRVWANFNYGQALPSVADRFVPEGLDYDMWLGPAPYRTYNPNRLHGKWRFQWDYGGGILTDWGVHLLDIVLWAMDYYRAPNSVMSTGGIFAYPDHELQTPDTQSVLYELDETIIEWNHISGMQIGPFGRNYGIAFYGGNGILVVNRAGWEVIPVEKDGNPLIEPIPLQEGVRSNHEQHAINFIECVRERKEPNCNVDMGYWAAFFAHAGNISYRSKEKLTWDMSKRKFVGSNSANQYIQPEYRKPWKFPM